MISVAFLSDWNQIHALRDRWEYLFSITQEASFTQSFEWYCAAFESTDDEPMVAVAVVAGKIIGVWPMFLRTARMPFGRVRTLRSGGLEAPFLGPIGPHPTATAALVARHMRDLKDWDSALLTAASRSNFDVARYTSAFRIAGLAPREEPAQPIGVIHVGARWTDLLSQCSDQVRFSLYHQRHGAGDDAFEFDRFRPAAGLMRVPSRLGEALELCATTNAERNMLRSTFETACRYGTADIALLRHRGQPLAAALSLATPSGLENHAVGFAPRVPTDVGIRLMDELLRDSQRRGDQQMTFVIGPGHPAVGWSTERRRRIAIRCTAAGHTMARIHRASARFLQAFRNGRTSAKA